MKANRSWLWLALAVCLFVLAAVIGLILLRSVWREANRGCARRGPMGHFSPAPSEPAGAPEVARVPLPKAGDCDAIWGATGRDESGRIWFGLSSESLTDPSAHLMSFEPETGKITDHGDVVSALKRAGICRKGEGQGKIHSRILQGGDGCLYFASMDIQGSSFSDGAAPPVWGGHLWRLRMPEMAWEHLAATEEGLISVAGTGRFLYALGFFGHKVFQYDLSTGEMRSLLVGAAGGHVSRNFFTDARDHVYVPRLQYVRDNGALAIELVELDTRLREISATPMDYYLVGSPANTHGIVSFQHMADGSIVFLTHPGRLYRVMPPSDEGAAAIEDLDWFHPGGRRYVASLFTYAGKRYLLGLSTQAKDVGAQKRYEWITYDLTERRSTVVPFEISPAVSSQDSLLLYGSMTRDNWGNCYVVGTVYGHHEPVLLQVRLPGKEQAALQIILGPPAAVESGGAWRVAGGIWHTSGETVDDLRPGLHMIEYRDAGAWAAPATEQAPVVPGDPVVLTRTYTRIMEVVVDNTDTGEHRGFRVLSGAWGTNREGRPRWPVESPNADYRYARAGSGEADSRAEWRCTVLGGGVCDVYAWWPEFRNYSMGRAVGYEVLHADGVDEVRADQSLGGGQWVLLGQYRFRAGEHVVRIHNGHSTPGDWVVADAVRFVMVEDP